MLRKNIAILSLLSLTLMAVFIFAMEKDVAQIGKLLTHKEIQENLFKELEVYLRDVQTRKKLNFNMDIIVDEVICIFKKIAFHQIDCKFCGDSSYDKGGLYKKKVYKAIEEIFTNRTDNNGLKKIYNEVYKNLYWHIAEQQEKESFSKS